MKKCIVAIVGGCLMGTLLAQKMVVNVPVASVWTKANPEELGAFQAMPASVLPPLPLLGCLHIPHHDTQLLYGERVITCDESVVDGWIKVHALEQPEFSCVDNLFIPVCGWVRAESLLAVEKFLEPNLIVINQWASVLADPSNVDSVIMHVPLGSLLHGVKDEHFKGWALILLCDGRVGFIALHNLKSLSALVQDKDIDEIRTTILCLAKEFVCLQSSYLWGGRSPYNPHGFRDVIDAVGSAASVDCSGLVNILYRANGLLISRNAHAQFKAASLINPSMLAPGDLIFLASAKSDYQRMNHVLIYEGVADDGNEYLIETSGEDTMINKCARCIQSQERLRMPVGLLTEMNNGDLVELLENGKIVGKSKLFCGTFLDREHIQQWRDALFSIT